ncbi:hypothetical protein MPSEU_000746000 [Mayamaea pseudoterrestris]|nr:hypothetical protein MPSEU_000746000 [Mayamaea pseudoterrestris]
MTTFLSSLEPWIANVVSDVALFGVAPTEARMGQVIGLRRDDHNAVTANNNANNIAASNTDEDYSLSNKNFTSDTGLDKNDDATAIVKRAKTKAAATTIFMILSDTRTKIPLQVVLQDDNSESSSSNHLHLELLSVGSIVRVGGLSVTTVADVSSGDNNTSYNAVAAARSQHLFSLRASQLLVLSDHSTGIVGDPVDVMLTTRVKQAMAYLQNRRDECNNMETRRNDNQQAKSRASFSLQQHLRKQVPLGNLQNIVVAAASEDDDQGSSSSNNNDKTCHWNDFYQAAMVQLHITSMHAAPIIVAGEGDGNDEGELPVVEETAAAATQLTESTVASALTDLHQQQRTNGSVPSSPIAVDLLEKSTKVDANITQTDLIDAKEEVTAMIDHDRLQQPQESMTSVMEIEQIPREHVDEDEEVEEALETQQSTADEILSEEPIAKAAAVNLPQTEAAKDNGLESQPEAEARVYSPTNISRGKQLKRLSMQYERQQQEHRDASMSSDVGDEEDDDDNMGITKMLVEQSPQQPNQNTAPQRFGQRLLQRRTMPVLAESTITTTDAMTENGNDDDVGLNLLTAVHPAEEGGSSLTVAEQTNAMDASHSATANDEFTESPATSNGKKRKQSIDESVLLRNENVSDDEMQDETELETQQQHVQFVSEPQAIAPTILPTIDRWLGLMGSAATEEKRDKPRLRDFLQR